MPEDLTLRMRLRARDETRGAFREARRNVNQLGRAIRGVAGIAIGFGAVTALQRGFRASVRATIEQQNAISQLNARLQSTGNVVGFNSRQLQQMASDLQDLTTYGDEATIQMQSLLLSFRRIRGDNFERATVAVLNLSTALRQDLRTTALQVGRALEDPARGLTALRRSGTTFTDEQKALVESLAESGRLAEAQTVILNELEVQYGGAAAAARNNLGGALKALSNAFGDLLEVNGGALPETVAAVERLTSALKEPETVRAVNTLTQALFDGFTHAAGAVRLLSDNIDVIIRSARIIGNILALPARIGAALGRGAAQATFAIAQLTGQTDRLAQMLGIVTRHRNDLRQPRGSELAGTAGSGALSRLQRRVAGVEGPTPTTPADIVQTEDLAEKIREATEALEHENRVILRARNEQAGLNALRRAGSTAIIGQNEAYGAFVQRLSEAEQGLVTEAERQIALRDQVRATADARREEQRAAELANTRVANALKDLSDQERAQLPLYRQRILAAQEWRESMRDVLSGVEEDWAHLEGRIEETYAEMIREAEKLRDDQKSVWEEIGEAVDRSMNRATDALLAFVSTGKASIGDFVRAVLLDLGRIALQRSIVQPLFSAIGGFLPGLAQATAVGHAGTIAGAATGVRRYHTGGIAGDEVPIIARRGEGIFTPEQMRALGPPTAPQVIVNIENAGTPVQETSRSVDADGRRTLVSIVVDDVDRRGDISRALEQGYGLSRRAR